MMPTAAVRTDLDPIVALATFHAGVRAALDAFDDVAMLARLGAVDPRKASALAAFFRGPMRRHDDVERQVLLPLLRVAHAPVRVERLVEACGHEHEAMERILDAVLSHIDDVAALRSDPSGRALTWAAEQLRQTVEPHLLREELEIFPLARLLLDDAGLAALTRAIGARAGSHAPMGEVAQAAMELRERAS